MSTPAEEIGKEVERETGEGTDLWRLVTAPTIWAAHFLVCYCVGAVWCEKAGRNATLWPAQIVIAVVTIVALAGIGAVFWSLWKVRGLSTVDDNYNYAGNTPEERHRFLSHVSLMLCVLSAVAVLYAAIPAAVLSVCR